MTKMLEYFARKLDIFLWNLSKDEKSWAKLKKLCCSVLPSFFSQLHAILIKGHTIAARIQLTHINKFMLSLLID